MGLQGRKTGRRITAGYENPVNYTPTPVNAENPDKVSAHLKGIDAQLAGTGLPAHNDTTSKQGGTTDEYYHLTEDNYDVARGVVTEEPTGFPNRTDSVVTFSDSPIRVTVAPAVTSFDYWIQASKTTISSTKTFTWGTTPIAEGLWYIYMNTSGDIGVTQTFSLNLFTDYAYVAVAYWDNTNSAWLYKGDERHGVVMDHATHADLHLSFGTTYQDGLGLSGFTIQAGAPTSDAAGQFQYAGGVIHDEDITLTIGASANPASIPVFYRSGSSAWRKQAADDLPVIFNSGTNLLRYNSESGGTWGQTDIGDGDYVLCHIFATNDVSMPVIAVQGQATYANIVAARTGADSELINLLTGGLPFAEFVPVATILYQGNDNWSNSSKYCKIVEYATGQPYVDWRGLTRTGSAIAGIAVPAHNGLTGLQGGQPDQYYHLTEDEHDRLTGGVFMFGL